MMVKMLWAVVGLLLCQSVGAETVGGLKKFTDQYQMKYGGDLKNPGTNVFNMGYLRGYAKGVSEVLLVYKQWCPPPDIYVKGIGDLVEDALDKAGPEEDAKLTTVFVYEVLSTKYPCKP